MPLVRMLRAEDSVRETTWVETLGTISPGETGLRPHPQCSVSQRPWHVCNWPWNQISKNGLDRGQGESVSPPERIWVRMEPPVTLVAGFLRLLGDQGNRRKKEMHSYTSA